MIDASTLLNLLATDRIEQIARSIADTCLICAVVEKECLTLRSADGSRVEPVTIDPYIASFTLTRCEMNEAEADDYVTFSASIDDGEAMSLAIARARGYSLVTDDRKARGFAISAGVSVYGTTTILRYWADENAVADVGQLLGAIERRARYRPPDDDPHFSWWMGLRQ